ncbi:hypothetical protein NW762_007942 [Fusarium torreyae]|uniref:Uncharacterized protein n=1 Tax=Fusarium torreyae TaxID=1237075 RepID=A0A9W8S0J3_9HYPO|nr:hypothetical protein NW762_007942 [Fusarium torreyae]
MAWAVGFLPTVKELRNRRIDWAKLYRNMEQLSNGDGPGGDVTIMGLQNRCRIWRICSMILDECSSRLTQKTLKAKKKANAPTKEGESILKGAISSLKPFLTFPKQPQTTYTNIGLAKHLKDLEKAEPIIRILWTATGELAGIGVIYSPASDTWRSIGSTDILASYEDVQIPKDDWLYGIIITTQAVSNFTSTQRKVVGIKLTFALAEHVQLGQAQGELRLLTPKNDHFIVGFRASWAPGKPLEKLALLQHSIEKAPSLEDVDRFDLGLMYDKDKHNQTREYPNRICYNKGLMDYFWKDNMPPREFDIWPCQHTHDFNPDSSPMEYVIFTPDGRDRENGLTIGVDAHFGGFEVIIHPRLQETRRSIGPRKSAMQYLSLGLSEELVCCHATFQDGPVGL